MHLHEYQAKLILKEYGIAIPDFAIISNYGELEQLLDGTGLNEAVVKVQIHAGGRGKAGGIKLARSRQEIEKAVKELLGKRIINNQTGKEGVVSHQLMISSLVDIKKEYYVAAAIDREKAEALLILSPQGGMDIEEVAAKTPHLIKKVSFDIRGSIRNYQLIDSVKFMGWHGQTAEQGKVLLKALVKAFVESDAMLLEINPLVETTTGDLIALDAKLTVDDNALFRQKLLSDCYDASQINVNEARAREYELAYIALDGNIGCMVNGAGLAMATMDIIKYYGGNPANFLDVGGGASQEKVAEGFKIILSDPQVKAILVNIFGGIMNCVTLAAGIIAATAESKVHVPLVIRMEGTNVEQGKRLLADSGLDIMIANDLAEAAQKAVQAAQQ